MNRIDSSDRWQEARSAHPEELEDVYAPRDKEGLGDLVQRLKREGKRYAHAEAEFVKAEARARTRIFARPAIWFGAAGVLGWFSMFALTIAVGFALAFLIGLPLGFLLTALLMAGGAYAAMKVGQTKLRDAKRAQQERSFNPGVHHG